jgi:hypothetical protein
MIKNLIVAIEFRRLMQGVSELTSPETKQMLNDFRIKYPGYDLSIVKQWAFPNPKQRVIESIARRLEITAKQLRKYH